jgi:hypothetical protein
LGGEALLESFADSAIDHESEVGEKGEDRRREGLREGTDEAPAGGHAIEQGE